MIIGFSGLMYSGKDTAGDVLVKNHDFIRIGFADTLKRFTQSLFQLSDAQVWGALKDAADPRYTREDGEPMTPRYAFQKLGTEWGRHCYPNVWVDDALRVAQTLTQENYHAGYYSARAGFWLGHNTRHVGGVVFTDVRFYSEMEGIKKAGGLLVRLKRGFKNNREIHASESEQLTIPDSYFNAVIENDDMSRDQFEIEVEKVYKSLC